MILEPVWFQDLSKINFRVFLGSTPVTESKVLVIAFSGVYGYGSKGNGDATFMSAVCIAAAECWHPNAVILDLRELDYQWGDMLASVFMSAGGENSSGPIPVVILAGDRSREGLISLVDDLFREPAQWIFDDLDAAGAALEAHLQDFKDESPDAA